MPVPHRQKYRSQLTSRFLVVLQPRRSRRVRPSSPFLTMEYSTIENGGTRASLFPAMGPGLDNHAGFSDASRMTYPGGKNGSGVYQRIISLMPPHDVYVEPFLGGGAIMRLKRPADLSIGLDLSGSAIAAFRDSAGGLFEIDDRAHGSGIVGSDERPRRASLSLAIGDGIGKLERIADGSLPLAGRILIYCDPPYLMSTRSGKRLYEHEMESVDHRRLLRVILQAENLASIMISGYASSLYARALKNWNSIQFESMTRGGYTKTEHLWFNFDPPTALHDYRYLGRDFRERERIKRQKQRWTARLDRMPVLQRQALLSAIADRQF